MAQAPGGARCADIQVDGIWLRHEADPADPRPEISGHFHPKFRLSVRGRHVSRRCFVESRTKLIRSEEHTSELQSLMRISYAVFCLKKKNKKNKRTNGRQQS